MYKIILVLIASALFLSACKDNDDFTAYSSEKVVKKCFLRGDGVWNFDEMTFWIVSPHDGSIFDEVVRTNVGQITFKAGDKMDIKYTNDTLECNYFTWGNSSDMYWSYLGGNIDVEQSLGHVATIDKNDMLLYFPSYLNPLQTDSIVFGWNVEYQFKLSKN